MNLYLMLDQKLNLKSFKILKIGKAEEKLYVRLGSVNFPRCDMTKALWLCRKMYLLGAAYLI
jgi:hypothetical protein